MWQSRNPRRAVPPYLRLEHLNTVEIPEPPSEEWQREVEQLMNESQEQIEEGEEPDDYDRAREIFPNWDSTKATILFTDHGNYGREVIVARLNRANARAYIVRNADGVFQDNIPPTLRDALKGPALTEQAASSDARMEAGTEAIDKMARWVKDRREEREELRNTIEEREREYARQNRPLVDSHGRDKADLQETLDEKMDLSCRQTYRQIYGQISYLTNSKQYLPTDCI